MVEVGTQDLLCDLSKHLQCCKVGPKFKGQGSSSKFSPMSHLYLHSWEALEVSLGEVKWPESTNDHSWWGRASTKERGERGVSNQDPQNERLRTLYLPPRYSSAGDKPPVPPQKRKTVGRGLWHAPDTVPQKSGRLAAAGPSPLGREGVRGRERKQEREDDEEEL